MFKSFLLGVVVVAIALASILGIGMAIEGTDFVVYKFFAPKQEAVRREVFKQSQAYNDGMRQQLSQEQIEYARSTKEQRDALRPIILHQYSDFDKSHLLPEQNVFLNQLQNESMGRY